MASEKEDGQDAPTTRTPDDDKAIEAEFKPTPPLAIDAKATSRTGPGWFALGLTGLVAAIGGAALALGLMGTFGQRISAPVTADTSALEASQAEASSRYDSALESLTEADADMQRALSQLTASAVDQETYLRLRADLDGTNARIDSLLGEGENGAGMSGLLKRIVALETADSEGEAVSPRLMNRAVTALRERVGTLETELSERRAESAAATRLVADLATRLEALESGNAETRAQALTDIEAEVAALREQITTAGANWDETHTQTTSALAASRGAAEAAIAFAMVESSASRGQPFQLAYVKLAEVMPSEKAVADLAPLASRGAPTLAGLSLSFEAAAEQAEALVAEMAARNDGWGWVRDVFGEDVSIGRADEGSAQLTASIARARAALDVSDLAAARSALAPLEGRPAGAFEAWQEAAGRRLILEESLQALRLRMIALE